MEGLENQGKDQVESWWARICLNSCLLEFLFVSMMKAKYKTGPLK